MNETTLSSIGVLVAVLAVSAPGCSQTPESMADEYISNWGNMGALLPDHEEVHFFAGHFAIAKQPLCQALSHPDDSVRMRAAYVIGEIGPQANSAGTCLLARLRVEPDETVRMYIVRALSTIRFDTDEAITFLKERFDTLDSTNDAPHGDYSYSEADEKIEVAATLFVLTNDDGKTPYLTYVTDWLKPPPSELSGPLLEGYWQRRWVAVTSLASMPGAVEAIPLLESLRNEPGARPWVEIHVPRALDTLRKSQSSIDRAPSQ